MSAFLQDLRHALRALRRRPGYTAGVVATWSLGLGAALAVFAVAWGVLWKPLPYAEPDRLVIVWQTDLQNDSDSERASAPDFRDFREQSRSFEALAGVTEQPMNLRVGSGETERVTTAGISHHLPELLGREPVMGRSFQPADDRPGAEPVALLSHELWRSRFGGDPDVVGSAVSLDEVPHTVVGVLPPGFDVPDDVQVWRPFEQTLGEFGDLRGVHNVLVVGRLAPGTSLEGARAEMDGIAARLEAAYPEDNVGRGVRLEPLHEAVAGDARPALLVLLGSVALLLGIAGANAVSLILSRGLARSRELGVRAVLGAGRGRIVRQLVLEATLLALVAGAAGLVLATAVVRLLRSAPGLDLPRAGDLAVDGTVAALGVGLALFVGALSGVVPALALSHRGLGAVADGGGGRAGHDGRTGAARGALVVAQVALAAILAVGAGLLGRSLWHLLAVDPGFEAEGVLLAELKLPESRYPAPRSTYPHLPEVLGFYDRALERVGALPGVDRVALAVNAPVERGWTSRVTVEGHVPPPGPPEEVRIRPVSPGYFDAVGIELLRGRALEDRDRLDAPDVLVVNRAFVGKYFGGDGEARDALGRMVEFWGTPRRIVGVVEDVRFAGLGAPVEPAIYPALHQVPMSQFLLVVRSGRSPTGLAPEVRTAVAGVDPDLALFEVRTLEEAVAESLGRPRFQLGLMGVYALLALLLSAVGVYGLLARAVAERTREIGVRVALGADRRRVVRLVLRRGAVLAAIGLVLGLLGASLLSELAASLLHGVRPLDPPTYAAVAAVLLATALAAAWLPARRAARLDPVEALRQE